MTKEEKIKLTVETYLEHPNYTIEELTELLKKTSFEKEGISKSSVQRYLSDPLVENLYSIDVLKKIRDSLDKNILDGRKKGGINSFKNNEPLKDDKGLFQGNKKTENEYRLEIKIADILFFAKTFLLYPEMSLQEIADFYNSDNIEKQVTRDYVYDCLTSDKQYKILSKETVQKIKEQLIQRRILGNIKGANTINKKR